MERSLAMVQAKVICLAAVSAVFLGSCTPRFSWQKFPMDGHRTGVTYLSADNVDVALGTVENGVYTAPNGTVFEGGATVLAASDMLKVQPQMGWLKKVIAYSPEGMVSRRPESPLSDFLVDNLMDAVAEGTGRKVDVGLMNFGGIRQNVPQGEVLLEDIVSMLPFNNYPVYVQLKGEDLTALFKQLAANGMEVIGGAEVEMEGKELVSFTVGGEPVDPEKLYGLATIDFLLDGGDGISVAKNARDLVMMDKILCDVILPRIECLTEAGKPLEYSTDGRVSVKAKEAE